MRKTAITRNCPICASVFTVKVSHATKGGGIYCSNECHGKGKTRKVQQIHEERYGMPIYDVLYLLHHTRQMCIREVAKELHTSTRTIYNWIEDLSFPVRSRSDAVALQWKDNDTRRAMTADLMRSTMSRLDMSGDNNPAKRPEVREKIRLSKLGPKNAMYGKTGSQNINWRGGKVDYRGPDWKEQRNKAVERDKHRCRKCKRSDCILEVHHKIPFRLCHDNHLRNLLTLCNKCHSAMETAWERTHPIEQRRLRIF